MARGRVFQGGVSDCSRASTGPDRRIQEGFSMRDESSIWNPRETAERGAVLIIRPNSASSGLATHSVAL